MEDDELFLEKVSSLSPIAVWVGELLTLFLKYWWVILGITGFYLYLGLLFPSL